MDAKRRKVDISNMDFGAVVDLGDKNLIYQALMRLKKSLTSRAKVISFIETKKSSFFALLTFLHKLSIEITGSQSSSASKPSSQPILRETISVLANLCHFSMTACAQIKIFSNVGGLVLRILESGEQTEENIKVNALRLAGNLCNFKETASAMTGQAGLIDRIVFLVMHTESHMANQSLRVIRLLSKSSTHSRILILSNTCYFIGTRILQIRSIDEVKKRQDILQILINLLKVYPKDVGRQLAGSGCATILLEIFFENALNDKSTDRKLKHKTLSVITKKDGAEKSSTILSTCSLNALWRTFLLKLTYYSFEIRETFGGAAIQRVMFFEELNEFECEFLCNFAQDAWCRVILRESGALSRLLDMIDSPQCNTLNQVKIIACLKHFIYDTQSMAYLCQRVGFVRVALEFIRKLLDEVRLECEMCFDSETGKLNQNATKSIVKRDYGLRLKCYNDSVNCDETVEKKDNTFLADCKERLPSEKMLGVAFDFSDTCKLDLEEIKGSSTQKEFFGNGAASPSGSTKLISKHSVYSAYDCHNWSLSMSPKRLPFFGPSIDMSPTLERSDVDFLDNSAVLSAVNELSMYNSSDDLKFGVEQIEDDLLTQKVSDNLDAEVYEDNTETEFFKKGRANQKAENEKIHSKARQQAINDCIDIISKLTHQEENYPFLIKQEVLETLIDYTSDAPVFDYRLARSIKRLARSKSSLQRLLEIKFHRIVITKLIRRKCILARFSKFCQHCDRRREFGCDLITEFAGHVDSNLGWNLMQIDFRSENRNVIRDAMINALILIRNAERVSRFYCSFMPIETLLNDLEDILEGQFSTRKKNVLDESDVLEDTEEGKICCEIIMAFSSLVTRRTLNNMPYLGLKFYAPELIECEGGKRCSTYEINSCRKPETFDKDCLLKRSFNKKSTAQEKLSEKVEDEILTINASYTEMEKKSFKNKNQTENVFQPKELQNCEMAALEEETLNSITNLVASNSKCVNSKDDIRLTPENQQLLQFFNAKSIDKDPILVVPKHSICSCSRYFQGMFENEFLEKVKGRDKFIFDERKDHCDECDFIKFLHYLCGCRDSPCVCVDSGETCVALLYLADKYLCPTLTKQLLEDDRTACILMNGANLKIYIPLMLTINSLYEALSSTWAFVLLRYSTAQQIVSTLSYFCQNPSAIPLLFDILQRFLLACTNGGTIYQNTAVSPLWDV